MSDQLMPPALLERVSRRFKMLSEPVRLELLNCLHVNGESSVQELVDATGHGQANVSKHLGLMHRAGLLHRRKEGLNVFYGISDPTLHSLCLLVCGQIRAEAAAEHDQFSGVG